jgi:hypothetical protein
VEDTFSPRIAATLVHRTGEGTSAHEVADIVVALCQDTERALTPIIGPVGVGALYQHSLHLAKVAYPWIDIIPTRPATAADFSVFHTLLAQQTAETALAGGKEVLEAFFRLLVSLIGFSLSEQLLAAVRTDPAPDTSAQDVVP